MPFNLLCVLKAENKVLDYIKRVRVFWAHTYSPSAHMIIDHDHDREQQINRPYGAVDISANLKGAVPKPATQKILLALAEKGDVTQKTYGMQCIAYKSRDDDILLMMLQLGRQSDVIRCESEYTRRAP